MKFEEGDQSYEEYSKECDRLMGDFIAVLKDFESTTKLDSPSTVTVVMFTLTGIVAATVNKMSNSQEDFDEGVDIISKHCKLAYENQEL